MTANVTTPANTSGGAATAGGMSFQNRVCAFYSVAILAERDAEPPFGLPADVTLEEIFCETDEPVDDVLVGTSVGGHILVQVKRTLDLSRRHDSPFASVVSQFVRQFLGNRGNLHPVRPWNKPLDVAKDRLVLIVGELASSSVRTALANVLNACRALRPDQPLTDAARNQSQRDALDAFFNQARWAWELTGSVPDTTELRAFAALCRVAVLAVEENGSDEQAAKDRLRRSVLNEPAQAPLAWDSLVRQAADLAQRRSGTDRRGIQRFLLDRTIRLRTPRSFAADVDRLVRATTIAMQHLEPLSRIDLGKQLPPDEVGQGRTIHLERQSSLALWNEAQTESLLVVGEPGAGKSGTLSDFCWSAQTQGHDCVLVLVDRVEARTAESFAHELGLEHDFVDVLSSWPGTDTGFVVFDALDAARDGNADSTIRDIISRIMRANRRWRVVASIRTFDLRHSHKLRVLFPGRGTPGYTDAELAPIRHLHVPVLSDEELAALGAQDDLLQVVLKSAPPELLKLLRVPFNVRLVAELLGEGVPSVQLNPIGTQLELLDRFWAHRVDGGDGLGHDRESLLHEICSQLVSRRALYADRIQLRGSATVIERLLSQNVLVEWRTPTGARNSYRIGFAHHVLFDYAVSRVLLRGSPDALSERLRESRDFALVVGPSIHFHLHHLWETDRAEFWTVALDLLGDADVPQIAGIIGPGVVAARARDLEELGPLLIALKRSDTRNAGAKFLRHLVGASFAGTTRVLGEDVGPWCQLAAALSSTIDGNTAIPIRLILARVLESGDIASATQLAAANEAARNLLAYAGIHPSADRSAAGVAIRIACRTMAGGHAQTSELVKGLLRQEHLAERGYLDLPSVAREIITLFTTDPDLTADVYIAAFSFHDTSSEVTPLGNSQLMPFASHRRQDYEGAWRLLAQRFPMFLGAQPIAAIRALAGVVEAYVLRDVRHHDTSPAHEETFPARGTTAVLRRDHSVVWDGSSARRHDPAIEMLDAFYAWLSQGVPADALESILHAFLTFAKSAVFWKRLLTLASATGSVVTDLAAEVCAAHPLLLEMDTSVAAGDFLAARFEALSTAQKRAIEAAVLSIPQVVPPERRARAEAARARLLGCIPNDLLSSPARKLQQELRDQSKIPKNEPPFKSGGFSSSPYTTEAHWDNLGVPLEEPRNRELLDLIEQLDASEKKFSTTNPSDRDVDELVRHVDIVAAILIDDADSRHASAIDAAWGYIAAACIRVLTSGGLDSTSQQAVRIRGLLLQAATERAPVFDAQEEEQFERNASWPSPSARIHAAEGLLILARSENPASPEVVSAIERLCRDPVSAVRYQIAGGLISLLPADLVWSLVHQMATEESNQTVLRVLLDSALSQLAGVDPNRATELTVRIFERVRDRKTTDARREAIAILEQLYICRGHEGAAAALREVVDGLGFLPQVTRDLLPPLRPLLTAGSDAPPETQARQRAIALMLDILVRAKRAFEDLIHLHESQPLHEWNAADRELHAELGGMINDVCEEAYFASGAFELGRLREDEPSQAVRSRFYREATTLIDELVSVQLAAGSHRVVEMLESYIDEEPREIFLRICGAVGASARSGYSFESLAEELVVRIARRYLADHKQLFRNDDECRSALIELLDAFVSSGWPRARELTYCLQDIFR